MIVVKISSSVLLFELFRNLLSGPRTVYYKQGHPSRYYRIRRLYY
jgi:hypothetical protein